MGGDLEDLSDAVVDPLIPEYVKKLRDDMTPEAVKKMQGKVLPEVTTQLGYKNTSGGGDPAKPGETPFEPNSIMDADKARRRLLRRAMFLSQDTDTARAGAIGL